MTAAAFGRAGEVDFVALYRPGSSGQPQSRVVAVGGAGQEVWSREAGREPVHRLATGTGTGFVAVATPRGLLFLDGRGNLLWSKTFRAPVSDVAIQSHGGPALIVGGKLESYDRRGNLLWRKEADSPMRALDCAAGRLAVTTDGGVKVYDEDGLERWTLATAAPAQRVALDPTGNLVAVTLEPGTVVVASAPGTQRSDGGAGQ